MKISNSKYGKYVSYVDDIMTQMEKSEFKLRKKAARHVRNKMRRKVNGMGESSPGQPPSKLSGNLRKGVKDSNGREASFVGAMSPAFHGHLVEFGHIMKPRKRDVVTGTNKYGPNKGKAKVVHVRPRPFVYPTFNEEAGAVADIMASVPWVK